MSLREEVAEAPCPIAALSATLPRPRCPWQIRGKVWGATPLLLNASVLKGHTSCCLPQWPHHTASGQGLGQAQAQVQAWFLVGSDRLSHTHECTSPTCLHVPLGSAAGMWVFGGSELPVPAPKQDKI